VFRGGVGLFSDLYPGTLPEPVYAKLPGGYHVFTDDGGRFTGQPETARLLCIAACNTAFQSNFNCGRNSRHLLWPFAPAGCQPPNLNDVVSQLRNAKYVEWNFEMETPPQFQNRSYGELCGNRGYDELVQFPY